MVSKGLSSLSRRGAVQGHSTTRTDRESEQDTPFLHRSTTGHNPLVVPRPGREGDVDPDRLLRLLEAVAVSLDQGGAGWSLPDDLDEVSDPGSWVALLPVLDPTVMGWQGRGFYLSQHLDSRGNAGTTA